MIKRGPPVRYPSGYPSRYPVNSPRRYPLTQPINHFPDKKPEKKQEKTTLSTSTKILVAFSLLLLSALVVFLIVKGLSNENDKDDEDNLNKFNADLKISHAQLLNYSDINVNVNKPNEEDNVEAIIFIFYDNNTEVTRRKVSILSLEEVNFQVVFHFANASRIDKISIIPVFKSSSGEEVTGEVEDQYVVESNNQSVIEEPEFNDTFICKSNSQCDDLNNCTRDICSKGNCSNTEIPNCVSCEEISQCEDLNACTTNKCLNGVCAYLAIPNCVQCYSSQQCDDNKLCTEDICFNDRCIHNPITNCTNSINNTNNTLECTTQNQIINCNDNNGCTSDTCVNNKCVNTPLSNCISCSSSTECNDYNSCTKDTCSTNKCIFTNVTSCVTGDKCCPKGCTYSNDGDCLPVCGNNIKEGTEKCDGTSLGGATCAGVLGTGYTGTLLCTNCFFNSSLCKPPCTQTCASLGYSCGTRIICGVKVDCGNCSFGYSCNVNGTCINRCTDSCSSSGLKECASSTSFRTCGNYDSDSCLEWGGLTSCGSGQTCSNGQCVENNILTFCGDGKCDSSETCSNCIKDCGSCQTYSGRVYYVSSSTGDDGNTGTSESSPWKSLSKVNSMTFKPGDAILFKRGDTFRGYLRIKDSGSSGNPITFSAYGSGAKPKIWGSKDYSSSSLWTIYSGNIWRTISGVTSSGDVANLIFNNESSYGVKKTSISSCTSQGDWYIDPSTSRVYLYSSSNPGNYYSHIEIGGAYIGETEEVIKIDSADYIHIRNLDVRYSPNNGIIFMYGCNHGIVEYCDVSWIGGMYVPSAYPYRMGNCIGVWVDANNITIRYNRINQCYDAGISPQGGDSYTQSNINMYYNIISNVWYCYELFTYPGSILTNVNFDNNVCYGMGRQWSAAQRPDKGNARAVIDWESGGTVTNCNVRNNIFKDSVNTAFRTDSNNIVLNFNNNLYDLSTIGVVGSSTYTTLSQWKSGTGQDSNSISGNPLFVSSSDFHLQSNSPAINKGVIISGLTKDFEGNSIEGLPDIGAYEYKSITSSCISHASSACYSNTGDVYWYDSCGVREEIRYDCTSTQTCSNGQCVNSGTTNPTGDIYYISPSGSDTTGDGSINKPWFSLTKAWEYVGPGDIIYMRGGTYRYTKQTLSGKSGTAGNYINVWAYPYDNTKPNITKSSSYGIGTWPKGLIYIADGNYLYFKGLEISNFAQEDKSLWTCFWVFNSENSIFENLDIHHCGVGAMFENIDNCLIFNCDFHHNSDPLTDYDVYGNADGVGMVGTDSSHSNTFRGCRSWWNTDDGYDLYDEEGEVIFENSWAWYNGFIPGTFRDGGDGNGFKYGVTNKNLPTTILRTTTNCISAFNEGWGFLDNGAKCNMKLYNNLAYYNCYKSFKNGWCGGYHFRLVSGIPYYIKNNIAYGNTIDDSGANEVAFDILTNINHNSWDTSDITVTDEDFVSLDVSQLSRPRKPDGSLPDVTFGHLVSGSDLINKGVNVGLSTDGYGSAIIGNPDLGAFEKG